VAFLPLKKKKNQKSKSEKKKKRFLCKCRDMSIFTFRTGRIIITGFENLDKITYIFNKYMAIVKAEEANIKVTSNAGGGGAKTSANLGLKKHKIMKVSGPNRHFKLFEVVTAF
jgi:TATA-box binding protein (TBP) (component of TFIID and TFIIIB)